MMSRRIAGPGKLREWKHSAPAVSAANRYPTMPEHFDICVIGGGLAGLSAAAGLAAVRRVVPLGAEPAWALPLAGPTRSAVRGVVRYRRGSRPDARKPRFLSGNRRFA